MLFVVTQLLAFLSAPEAQNGPSREARTRPGYTSPDGWSPNGFEFRQPPDEAKPPEGWTPVGSIPDHCYNPAYASLAECGSYWAQYHTAAMANSLHHYYED